MRYIIHTGKGMKIVKVVNSLDEATAWVRDNLVDARSGQGLIWRDCQSSAIDGGIDWVSWNAPTRPMTRAEIDAYDTEQRFKKAWRENPPLTDDRALSDRLYVFPSGFVDSVQIVREDRARQGEIDAAIEGNDVRARVAALQAALA